MQKIVRAAALGPAVALMVSATAAEAFLSRNSLRVEPRSATEFSVPYRGRSAAIEFWCAAGDYVVNGLRAARTTRIYRTNEPPRRSGEPMRFSLTPAGSASRTGLIRFPERDGSLSAGHALALCETARLLRDQ